MEFFKNEVHILSDNYPLRIMDIRTSDAIKNKSTVIFGHYEQDSDLSNGTEEIQCKVLDASNDHILLVSKYILDYQQIHKNSLH